MHHSHFSFSDILSNVEEEFFEHVVEPFMCIDDFFHIIGFLSFCYFPLWVRFVFRGLPFLLKRRYIMCSSVIVKISRRTSSNLNAFIRRSKCGFPGVIFRV